MVRTGTRSKSSESNLSHRRWLVYVALAALSQGAGCSGRDRTQHSVCSSDGFCWQRPSPQGNNLHALSGLSSRYIWAVGDHGTILHYDGQRWASSPSGTTENLHGVFSLSQRDAWAVGAEGTALHYDGSAWQKVESGTKEALFSTWAASGSDVYIVGKRGTFLHWDGKAIKKGSLQNETASLHSIFGFDGSDIWVVGENGFARHFDGSEWRVVSGGSYNDFGAVFGHRPREVWLGTGTRYSGRISRSQNGIHVEPVSSYLSGKVSALWGGSSTDIWAGSPSGTLYRFDGKEWKQQKERIRITALWGSGGSDIWAAGPAGTLAYYDGKSWTLPPSDSPATVTALWAPSRSEIWAVQGSSLLRFVDGFHWPQALNVFRMRPNA